MAEIVLNVEVRERTGTGGARVTRREGLVPGILYGGDKGPVAISMKANEFRKALYTGKLLGHLVTLKYGKETQPMIAKAFDMHPVADHPDENGHQEQAAAEGNPEDDQLAPRTGLGPAEGGPHAFQGLQFVR